MRWLALGGALLTLAGMATIEIGLWALFIQTSRELRIALFLTGTACVATGVVALWLARHGKPG